MILVQPDGAEKGVEMERYLLECVRVDPLRIEDEFVRVLTDTAYWNERYLVAFEAFLRAKLFRDRTYASAEMRIRMNLEDTGKKATEAMVKAMLEGDDEVYEANVAWISAEVEKVRLHGILEAIRGKREALISIGAHIRSELAGNPSLRAQADASRYHNSSR